MTPEVHGFWTRDHVFRLLGPTPSAVKDALIAPHSDANCDSPTIFRIETNCERLHLPFVSLGVGNQLQVAVSG